MSIIDEFKYEKLMTNSYVDQISVQFLKLFKEFSTLKVTEDELDKCIALASSDYQQDHYHEQNLSNYIAPEKKKNCWLIQMAKLVNSHMYQSRRLQRNISAIVLF